MLARHEGLVVLVAGAIPGERGARAHRARREVARLRGASSSRSRRTPRAGRSTIDPRCGGTVYAHIEYDEQLRLKGEIIRDALARLGRIPRPTPIAVAPSPETRLPHARPPACAGRARRVLPRRHARDLRRGADAAAAARRRAGRRTLLASDLSGRRARRRPPTWSSPRTAPATSGRSTSSSPDGADAARCRRCEPVPGRDRPELVPGGGTAARNASSGSRSSTTRSRGARLRRHARAFFQGNRFLLDGLVAAVLDACPDRARSIDLYAGVGLFGVCLAAGGPSPRHRRRRPRRVGRGPEANARRAWGRHRGRARAGRAVRGGRHGRRAVHARAGPAAIGHDEGGRGRRDCPGRRAGRVRLVRCRRPSRGTCAGSSTRATAWTRSGGSICFPPRRTSRRWRSLALTAFDRRPALASPVAARR